MADNSYGIEFKIASKNGWHTPQEARAFYGVYSREGFAIHWWGGGESEASHDNLVNYELTQARLGNKSVNYVVSDAKITLIVSPDNVAWSTYEWNPRTISIEIEPQLSAEGYKKLGWLIWQLRQRYNNNNMWLKGHNTLRPGTTACPGTLNIPKMEQEAQKFANGGYNPQTTPVPTPTPTPSVAQISYSPLPAPVKYIVNKDTKLWNFNSPNWPGVQAIKTLSKGSEFMVHTIADNHNLHAKYGMTKYSAVDAKTPYGVNMVDLDLAPTPQPIPTPSPDPAPPYVPPAPVPEPAPEPDKAAIIAFLEMLVKVITDFLGKFRR